MTDAQKRLFDHLNASNNDPEIFIPAYYEGRGISDRDPGPWPIRTARFFGSVKDSHYRLFAVTRFSVNVFVIDEHEWKLEKEHVRFSTLTGELSTWNREEVRYTQRSANILEVNGIFNEFKEYSAGDYQMMSKSLFIVMVDTLEVGKTGRKTKGPVNITGDTINFPE